MQAKTSKYMQIHANTANTCKYKQMQANANKFKTN